MSYPWPFATSPHLCESLEFPGHVPNSKLTIAMRNFFFFLQTLPPELILGNRRTRTTNRWAIERAFSPERWTMNVAVHLPGYLYAQLFVWAIERSTRTDRCRKTIPYVLLQDWLDRTLTQAFRPSTKTFVYRVKRYRRQPVDAVFQTQGGQ